MNRKIIVPIANSNKKQIDQEIEFIIEKGTKVYNFVNRKALKELKISKNCIFKKNSKFITSYENEFIEIEDNIKILNNVRNWHFNSTCDNRRMILNGNFFIDFQNCSIQIENFVYSNKAREIFDKFILPLESIQGPHQKNLTFDELVIHQEKNITEIRELQHKKNLNIGIGISSLLVSFLLGIQRTQPAKTTEIAGKSN